MSVFEALADPTRRSIVELLAESELSVSEIQTHFRLSQPAISKHLRVLRDAGIALADVSAQRRIYRLQDEALAEAETWIVRNRSTWAHRLDALQTHVEDR